MRAVIIFVRSFRTHSVSAMGLVSRMLVGASVFGMDRTRALRQSCGMIPVCSTVVIKLARGIMA